MKFLVIILVVLGLIFMGILVFLKFIRNTLSNLFTPQTNPHHKKEEDVLYRNDDVIVLKGEAKDNTKNKTKEKNSDA